MRSSFPQRRESIVAADALLSVASGLWIPAFAGMTARIWQNGFLDGVPALDRSAMHATAQAPARTGMGAHVRMARAYVRRPSAAVPKIGKGTAAATRMGRAGG